mmetsp:Transcript_5889/g.17729  ORF Transcript_5889/g.17729 Transcript_5889/m.17729 type:complete len:86 (+) Transcript_5889:577-834(+)
MFRIRTIINYTLSIMSVSILPETSSISRISRILNINNMKTTITSFSSNNISISSFFINYNIVSRTKFSVNKFRNKSFNSCTIKCS